MGNAQGKGIKSGFVFWLSFNVSNEIFAKEGELWREGVYNTIMLGWAFELSY